MTEGSVLRIEPGAAERIARAFELHAENLQAVALRLRTYSHATGFAGFPSAIELDAGFSEKGRRAVAHLQGQIETVLDMAATIRAAGAAYVASDNANSSDLRITGAGPGDVSETG